METKLKINWDEAPEGFPFWLEAIYPADARYSGWHRQDEQGDFVDQKGVPWYASNEGVRFRAYRLPEPALITALRDCVSVMERELSGLAVIQPELKAAREALAAAGTAPTAWSGEGLPPVGTVCEWQDRNSKRWLPVEIMFSSSWVIVVRDTHPHPDGPVDLAIELIGEKPEFRPLRTPEQIAAEEREKAIAAIERLLIGHYLSDKAARAAAEAMHDAGYRKGPRTADLLRALKDIATASEQSTVLGLKQMAAGTLAAVEGGAA